MSTFKLNTYVYELTTVLLYITIAYFLWTIDKQFAVLLVGLQVMRDISKFIVLNEMRKSEEELSKELDAVIQQMNRNKDV
jgi:hypothetical protein